jgi:hypothetical protein
MQNKKDEKRLKNNLIEEAEKLTGQILKGTEQKIKRENKKKKSFLKTFFQKINIYSRLKNKIKEKQLVDEVTLLMEENNNINQELAAQKL